MLPEGWERHSIGRISGPITSGSRGWAAYYADAGSPFLRITNLRRDNIIPDYGDLKYVSLPSNSQEGQRTRLSQGDILVSITADLGVIGYIDKEPEAASYINQHIARVRIKRGSAIPKFIAYQLASPHHRAVIQRLNDSGAKAGLNLPTIKSIPVLLPPLPEQHRIAEILSTWDRAIETVEALIANARTQKRALMQSLLTGKHRLPGFNGEWRSVCLGEIGKLRKGKGIQRDQVRAKGLPCIRYGEIYTQHHEQVRHFNSFIDAETAADSVPISAGDILFTCSGETAEEIGKCVAYLGSERAYAGGDIIILSPATDNAAFLSYVLNDTEVTEQKRRFGQGNSVVHISAANLARLTFTLPDRAEQDAIANVLVDATGHIGGLEIELATLAQEKSALMQQLLTGKRRVKLTESEHS